MKYRNSKTGFELDAACPISGGDWVPVESAAPAVSKSDTAAKSAKKTTKKGKET